MENLHFQWVNPLLGIFCWGNWCSPTGLPLLFFASVQTSWLWTWMVIQLPSCAMGSGRPTWEPRCHGRQSAICFFQFVYKGKTNICMLQIVTPELVGFSVDFHRKLWDQKFCENWRTMTELSRTSVFSRTQFDTSNIFQLQQRMVPSGFFSLLQRSQPFP